MAAERVCILGPPVLAGVAGRIGEHADRQVLTLQGLPGQHELRMQGITRPGAQVEPAPVVGTGLRRDPDLIGGEFVGTLVGRVEDRIIELVVETVQRIRHLGHGAHLLEIREAAHVVVGHLDRLVDILRGQRRAERQDREGYV